MLRVVPRVVLVVPAGVAQDAAATLGAVQLAVPAAGAQRVEQAAGAVGVEAAAVEAAAVEAVAAEEEAVAVVAVVVDVAAEKSQGLLPTFHLSQVCCVLRFTSDKQSNKKIK